MKVFTKFKPRAISVGSHFSQWMSISFKNGSEMDLWRPPSEHLQLYTRTWALQKNFYITSFVDRITLSTVPTGDISFYLKKKIWISFNMRIYIYVYTHTHTHTHIDCVWIYVHHTFSCLVPSEARRHHLTFDTGVTEQLWALKPWSSA